MAVAQENFKGLRVASFESRKAVEMAGLITKYGGDPLVTPSLKEIPLKENTRAMALGERLFAGHVDVLVLLTGIGAQILFEALSEKYGTGPLVEKLKHIRLLARGPKPTAVLKSFGLTPAFVVPEPNTWREVLDIMDKQLTPRGLAVAIQEYGTANEELISGLIERGADVIRVPVYRWALPEDTTPLQEALKAVIEGKVDVLVFTNSHQITNVMRVAQEHGLEKSFRLALDRAVVVSVGPRTSECLDEYGFAVDIEADESRMEPLVIEASQRSAGILERKRTVSFSVETSRPRADVSSGVETDALEGSVFMRACRRKPVWRTPIWLMRQAGRYMPSYRDLRRRVTFLELCKNSDLAADVTIQAREVLSVDAAIIFSDILLVVEPMGLDLAFTESDGPVIRTPVREARDVERLLEVDPFVSLGFVFDAIRKSRNGLPKDIPLIGFSGAPFTLASYMIEGGSSRNFVRTKSFMYRDFSVWNLLMNKISDALIVFLNAQIESGAQAVQIFDSWVGCLSPHDYEYFVLPYSRRVIAGLKKDVPVIYFGTQTSELLGLLSHAGGDVMGLDWRVELDQAWKRLENIGVQGNLDPAFLLSHPDVLRKEVDRIMRQAGGRPGHIFNLGHGVLPDTPVEHARLLVDLVHNWKN